MSWSRIGHDGRFAPSRGSVPSTFMTSRIVVSLVGLSLITACGDFRRTHGPQAGLHLEYAIDPSLQYLGHVRSGGTREYEGFGAINQSVSFDVGLVALNSDEQAGGTLMRAYVHNVHLEWTAPDTPEVELDDMFNLANRHLEGTGVLFSVDEHGRITRYPSIPADTPPAMLGPIQAAHQGILSAFVELSPTTVRAGSQWTATGPAPTGQELSASMTLESVLEDRVTQRLVTNIAFERNLADRDVGDPLHTRQSVDVSGTIQFDMIGFARSVEQEEHHFGDNVMVRQVRSEWEPTALSESQQILKQDIVDPCDPDYAGTGTCSWATPTSATR